MSEPKPASEFRIEGKKFEGQPDAPEPKPATGECANIHIEHYFPKGYDPEAEPWKSIRQYHNAALDAERESSRAWREDCPKALNDYIDKRIAEAQKPLVDALRDIAEGRTEEAAFVAQAALAKLGKQ